MPTPTNSPKIARFISALLLKLGKPRATIYSKSPGFQCKQND